MDDLKKAVLLLWKTANGLERDLSDTQNTVEAIIDVVMMYIGELKIAEQQHPKTIVAMVKLIEVQQSQVNRMAKRNEERLKTVHAMTEAIKTVLADLAINDGATLQ